MLQQALHRFRCLWHRRRKDAELDEEIRFHLAEEVEERIDAGLAPEEARATAQRDFGNVTLTRELTRETWGWAPVERLLKDAGFAFRMMRRNTGYTCAVVLTLALGIGLNAPMYEMLSRLFLQAPPHIEDPKGVHRVWLSERDDSDDRGVFTGPATAWDRMQWPEFSALTSDNALIDTVAGRAVRFVPNGRGQRAEILRVSWVTGEFLNLLGASPALGRAIGPEDDDLAAQPVAVISDGYRRQRFGGAEEALGATLSFDDVAYVVVGVMPPGFSGPDPNAVDVWLPLEHAASASREDNWRRYEGGFYFTAFARLAPGATVEAAGRRGDDRRARGAFHIPALGLPGPGGNCRPGSHPENSRPLVAAASDAPATDRWRRHPSRTHPCDRQHVEPTDAASRRQKTRASHTLRPRRRPGGESGDSW